MKIVNDIKFRIWDVELQEFIQHTSNVPKTKIFDIHTIIEESGDYFNCRDGEFIIQKYTGYVDMDKKEVFVGDIIRIHIPCKMVGHSDVLIGVVIEREGVYILEYDNGNRRDYLKQVVGDGRVIGNLLYNTRDIGVDEGPEGPKDNEIPF